MTKNIVKNDKHTKTHRFEIRNQREKLCFPNLLKTFLAHERALIATDRDDTLPKWNRAPGAPFGLGFDPEKA